MEKTNPAFFNGNLSTVGAEPPGSAQCHHDIILALIQAMDDEFMDATMQINAFGLSAGDVFWNWPTGATFGSPFASFFRKQKSQQSGVPTLGFKVP